MLLRRGTSKEVIKADATSDSILKRLVHGQEGNTVLLPLALLDHSWVGGSACKRAPLLKRESDTLELVQRTAVSTLQVLEGYHTSKMKRGSLTRKAAC